MRQSLKLFTLTSILVSLALPAFADDKGKIFASMSAPGAKMTRYSLKNCVYIDQVTEATGIRAEYDWISENLPGWKRVAQAAVKKDDKLYDVLFLENGRGKKNVCFDITKFFGKN